MTKKYGKDTFRRSKKKILHKKGINTKKRGLRGGDLFATARKYFNTKASKPKFSNTTIYDPASVLTQSSPASSQVSPQVGEIHGIYGSALTDSMKLSRLTSSDCTSLLGQITDNPKKSLTNNAKTEVRLCKEKFYSDLNVKFPRPDSMDIMQGVEYFDTQLSTKSTNSNPAQTLTLRNCKVIKNPIHSDRLKGLYNLYEYRIFSPAVSTLPPIGGTQKETPVGTFTQFPVSVSLTMAGQETPFDFASFYNTDDRKEYFSDYMSCLQNVKEKFVSDKPSDYANGQYGAFLHESSKLQTYGKSDQCKIILVAGNIGVEIQSVANNGAIFVLPSQFNGAEYPDPLAGPKTTLETYKGDKTGGPIGQLSCHPLPAEFVRLYAARKLPKLVNEFSSDFLVINAIDDVVKTLSSLLPGMTLNNGYLEVPANLQSEEEHDLSSVENENTTAIFNALCQQLKVLLMSDIPPNGLKPPLLYTSFNSDIGKDHIVNLVYASAVPLKYVYYKPEVDSTGNAKLTEMPPINLEKSTLQYCVAGFDLVAQYFGAMVSAYHKSKQLESTAKAAPAAAEAGGKIKLFLTPLGGGVFNNPRELIGCSVLLAYYQAQQLFADFDDKVQVNFLAWNKSSSEVYDFSKFFNFYSETAKTIVDNMQETLDEQTALKTSKASVIASEASDALQPVSPTPASETSGAQQESEEAAQPSPAAVDADVIPENVNKPTPEVTEPLSTQQNPKEKLQIFKERLEKIKKHKIDTEREKEEFDTSTTEKINKIDTYLKQTFPNISDFTKQEYIDIMRKLNQLKTEHTKQMKSYESELKADNNFILALTTIISMIENNTSLPDGYNYDTYMLKLIKEQNENQGPTSTGPKILPSDGPAAPLDDLGGGSKSRRRHRRKPARKTTRKSKSKSKSKSKPKTQRRRRTHHLRTRKHKKYTSQK